MLLSSRRTAVVVSIWFVIFHLRILVVCGPRVSTVGGVVSTSRNLACARCGDSCEPREGPRQSRHPACGGTPLEVGRARPPPYLDGRHALCALDLVWLNSEDRVVAVLAKAPPCSAQPCPLYKPKGTETSQSVLKLRLVRLRDLALSLALSSDEAVLLVG